MRIMQQRREDRTRAAAASIVAAPGPMSAEAELHLARMLADPDEYSAGDSYSEIARELVRLRALLSDLVAAEGA